MCSLRRSKYPKKREELSQHQLQNIILLYVKRCKEEKEANMEKIEIKNVNKTEKKTENERERTEKRVEGFGIYAAPSDE